MRNTSTSNSKSQTASTVVSTPYGDGRVAVDENNNENDDDIAMVTMKETATSYGIQLPYGTLYVPKEQPEEQSYNSNYTLTDTQTDVTGRSTTTTSKTSAGSGNGMSAEELNAAFESLEKVRRLNLEVECHELGISCDHEKCVLCLFASAAAGASKNTSTSDAQAQATTNAHSGGLLSIGRLFRRGDSNSSDTSQKSRDKLQQQPNKGSPCLICGDPVCLQHSSSNFRKEKLTLCLGCEELFQLDFANNNNNNMPSTTTEQQEQQQTKDSSTVLLDTLEKDDILLLRNQPRLEQRVDRMITIYHRCMLFLAYTSQAQLMSDLATQLDTTEVRNNQFRLGTSSAGFLSGTLGFAAASALFAPLGAPLILASVVLAGGSLVAQGGNAAVNYFDQANQLADKIITYHGMVLSILQAAHSLRIRILAIQSEQQAVNEQAAMELDTQQQQQQQDNANTNNSTDTNGNGNDNDNAPKKNKADKLLKTMSVVGTVKTTNDVTQYTAAGLKVAKAMDTAGTAATATAATTAGTAAAAAAAADTTSNMMVAGTTAAAANAAETGATVATAANAAETGATVANAAETAATTTNTAAKAGGGGSHLLSNVTTGVTPIIGTVFSVAMMALAARTATSTLKKIRAGNPCDKADTLRTIQTNLESFPPPNELDEECRYLMGTISSSGL